MKTVIHSALGMATLAALLTGCGKKEEAAPPPPKAPEMSAPQKQLNTVVKDASAKVEAVAEQAEQAAAEVQTKVQALADDGQAKIAAAMADIQKLMGAKDWVNALPRIKAALQMPGLTAENQTTLQKWLAAVQKALMPATGDVKDAAAATQKDATKAVGGMLKLGQ